MMSATVHTDPIAGVLFWIVCIFSFGLVGRNLARLCQQPAVLGELLMGILLGNVCYLFAVSQMLVLREGPGIFEIVHHLLMGLSMQHAVASSIPHANDVARLVPILHSNSGFEWVQVAHAIDVLAQYGVIFLLFMVGLESSVQDIRETGMESLRVALIGVFCPILLGFGMMLLLMPEASVRTNLFVAATLSATSVGITARVLKEMKKLRTREAKTILGAAVIDDILGLIILALVSSVVISGRVDAWVVLRVLSFAVLYFAAVLTMGPWLLRYLVRALTFLPVWEKKVTVSFLFLMLLSYLATKAELASIIGAFTAGLIIKDTYFDDTTTSAVTRKSFIHDLIAPIEALLAPLFFMLIGIQVKLEMFFDVHVLAVAAGLIVAAIVGKLVSGWGASSKVDRCLIGVGMLPRGEVGLIFASIGRGLGVITDELFSAIILMVIVTTCIAPPWIKARFNRQVTEA